MSPHLRDEDVFGHFLIASPPALSFPRNQLQSVTGMEGEITLKRHHEEISAQFRDYLMLLEHPAGALCQTTRLQRVHTGRWGGQIEGHGRITDGLINSFVIWTFCLPLSVLLHRFCVSARVRFQCRSLGLSGIVTFRVSPRSPSPSPSVSHCISITLPSFILSCE